MKKRITFLCLILTMLFVMLSMTAFAANSGTCGSGVYWSYDSGTLTISGNGRMNDYDCEWENTRPWADYESDIQSIVIGDGITYIGQQCFGGATFLACGYDNLKNVTIGSGVTEIGNYAFMNAGISSISLPSGLSKIGIGAFECTNIDSVTIPASVTSIGANAFAESFGSGDTCRTPIVNVASGNEYYCSSDGVLFEKAGSNLILMLYPSTKTNKTYTIPANCVGISENWFSYNASIEELIIPGTIESIHSVAFGFPNLSKLDMLDGVKHFSPNANLYGKTKIFVPSSVESLTITMILDGGAGWDREYYFYGDAPDLSSKYSAETFNQIMSGETIYYSEETKGWENLKSKLTNVNFQIWTPNKTKTTQQTVELTAVSPANGATNVSRSDSLILTFSCNIGKNPNWNNGGIHIVDASTGENKLTIDDKKFYSLGGTINDNVISIPKVFEELEAKSYSIIIDANVFNAEETGYTSNAGLKCGDVVFNIAAKKAIIVVPGITGSEIYTGNKSNPDIVWMDHEIKSDAIGTLVITNYTNALLDSVLSGDFSLVPEGTEKFYNLIAKMWCDSNGNPKADTFTADESVSPYGTYFSGYTYETLVNLLRKEYDSRYGGSGEYEVRFFSYDWRLSNEKSAKKLADFIDDNGYNQVVLVAHSMGGIVSSVYMAENGYDKVEKYISLGTPYYGAPKALYAFEEGKFLDISITWPFVKALAPNVAGLYQLLPMKTSFNTLSGNDGYVYCNWSPRSYNATYSLLSTRNWYNSTLYTEAVELYTKRFSYSSIPDVYSDISSGKVDSYVIVGYDNDTVIGLDYTTTNDDSYYLFDVRLGEGDGTVPILSATMNNATFKRSPYYVKGVNHSGLAKNKYVSQLVKNIIGGIGDSEKYLSGCGGIDVMRMFPSEGTNEYYKIKAACPITLEVYDKTDNLIGSISNDTFDCVEGYEEDFHVIGENKIAFLDSDDYYIVIKGNDTGTMDLTIEKIKGEEVSSYIAFDDVPVSTQSIMNINVSTDYSNVLEIDNDGDGKADRKMMCTDSSNGTMLNPFIDIKESDYYYDAVLWAVENNITSGTSATTFSPNADCTRAQMVTFLWRTAGCPEPTSEICKFTDVKNNEYYYKAVLWAVEKGITDGISETIFAPDATCTRAQTVTFLYRYAGSPTVSANNIFTDVKDGEYYYDAVLWAIENGITEGTSKTTFSPDDNCTRAQIVTFLYRNLAK